MGYWLASFSWSQAGNEILGTDSEDYHGNSISISASGTTVAVGAWGHDNKRGTARVYRFSSSAWSQVGEDLDGKAENDYQGRSVSLSSNGLTLAVGAYGHQNNKGTVRIYNIPPEKTGAAKESITLNSQKTWTQIGNDIDGEGSKSKLQFFWSEIIRNIRRWRRGQARILPWLISSDGIHSCE